MQRRARILLIIISSLLWNPVAPGDEKTPLESRLQEVLNELKNYVEKLETQLTHLKNIEIHIEQKDLGRVRRLAEVTEEVIKVISDPKAVLLPDKRANVLKKYAEVFGRALGENKTILNQLGGVRTSEEDLEKFNPSSKTAFLKTIRSAAAAVDFDIFIEIYKTLADTLDLRQPLYTYNTVNMALEMKEALKEAKLLLYSPADELPSGQLRIQNELRKYISMLYTDMERLALRAGDPELSGDHQMTLDAAKPVCAKVRLMYQLFYSLELGSAASDLCFRIQGINEDYIGHAKIQRGVEKIFSELKETDYLRKVLELKENEYLQTDR